MTYKESERIINDIRDKNEVVFRMAISHLMDVGIRYLTDENVEHTCESIMKQDDKHMIMTNEFQCEIVRTAAKFAEIDHIYLLVYIQRNLFWDVGDNYEKE